MKKFLLVCMCTMAFFLFNEKRTHAQDTIVFDYVGDSVQTWLVPCKVDSITIEMWGAGGGSGYQSYYNDAWCGGSGAYMMGVLSGAALPGQTLTLYVPHGGQFVNSGYVGGAGGWPGGGNGGNDGTYSEWGAGGGGYAAVAIGANYYAVAGAGGGGGSTEYGGTAYGGGGGATTGGDGVTTEGYAGTGATISAGGTGGAGYSLYGDNGSFLQGGNGQAVTPNGDYGGGGGGGGYYGGGGGGDEGNSGGGGSSFPASPINIGGITFNPVTNIAGTMNAGTTGSAVAPGSPSLAGVGNGNIDANGGNGEIRLIIKGSSFKFLKVKGNAINNVSCIGDSTGTASAIVSGGTPPYTYSWNGGQTTDTITGLTAGTYTVNVTDSASCTVQAMVTITQPPTLTASAVQYGHIRCSGEPGGNVASTVTGGTLPYTYSWAPAGGTKDTATGILAGTYTLTVTDPCNDTAITTVVVTEPAPLIVAANQISDIMCHGGSQAQASATVTGGTGAYTYAWNNGDSTDTISGLNAVTFTVNVTDSNGCLSNATVTITQPAPLKLVSHEIPDTGGCHGGAWLDISGGTAPYSLLWSDGSTTDTVTGECTGTICCTVTDAHGCVNYNCATITSTVGVQNISNSSSIKVYPDPNTGVFTISGLQHGQVIEMYNYMGQRISSSIVDNNNDMQVNISAQPNGIYMVRILNSNGTLVIEKRILKVQ